MKRKIIILIIAMLGGMLSAQAGPYDGRTKHRPVKRMKAHQVRRAADGKSYYYRSNSGNVKKRGLINLGRNER